MHCHANKFLSLYLYHAVLLDFQNSAIKIIHFAMAPTDWWLVLSTSYERCKTCYKSGIVDPWNFLGGAGSGSCIGFLLVDRRFRSLYMIPATSLITILHLLELRSLRRRETAFIAA